MATRGCDCCGGYVGVGMRLSLCQRCWLKVPRQLRDAFMKIDCGRTRNSNEADVIRREILQTLGTEN